MKWPKQTESPGRAMHNLSTLGCSKKLSRCPQRQMRQMRQMPVSAWEGKKNREAKRGLLGEKDVIFHTRAYNWWFSLIFLLLLNGNCFDQHLQLTPLHLPLEQSNGV